MPVLLIFNLYFNHKTEGFFRSPGAWTLTIALASKRLCDPMTWRHNSYNVTSRRDNDLSQTPRASSRLWKKTATMSRDIRFPTMWYVRPAKTQISLRIHTVWSEPLLVAWIFYACYATDWTSFGVSKLKRRLHRLVKMTHCWKSHVAAQIKTLMVSKRNFRSRVPAPLK